MKPAISLFGSTPTILANQSKMETPARRVLYTKRPEMSHQERLMKEINAYIENLREIAYNKGSFKDIIAYWNKKVSPKIDLYGGEYLGYGGAEEFADDAFADIKYIYIIVNSAKLG